MRLTDHTFTESTPCHAIDPVGYDLDAIWAEEEALSRRNDAFDAQSEAQAVRLADIDFDALVAGWNGPEVQAARAEQNAFFEATMGAKRDADKAREWGCTVAELPWNARKAGSLGWRA